MLGSSSFLKGFILGGFAGAALALFFAPHTGDETVVLLKDWIIEQKDYLEENLLNLQADLSQSSPSTNNFSTTTMPPKSVAHNGHHS